MSLIALPQFVECRTTAREQRAAVDRRLDAASAAIEKPHAERMLEIGNHLRHGRLGYAELRGCLG